MAANDTPDFILYGTQERVMDSTAAVLCHHGPAGTGKSFGGLIKLDTLARMYPGARCLLTRRTRVSLVQSTLVTFEKKVLGPLVDPVTRRVVRESLFSEKPSNRLVYYHGGDQEYRYPNKSIAAIAGLDKSAKVMSTEWDFVVVDEATETNEDMLESLTTRTRNYVADFQQVLLMCNPDSPQHFIKKKGDAGIIEMVKALHTDNPALYDQQTMRLTAKGYDYIVGKLEQLTGVRYKRLRKGIWCTTDGMVFDGFDDEEHLFDGWEQMPDESYRIVNGDLTGRFGDASDFQINPPRSYRRTLSVDFGYSDPMVVQFHAEDEDHRDYLWQEIFHTGLTVEDVAAEVIKVCDHFDEPEYDDVICDHDAGDRATLIKHLAKNWRFARLTTTAAKKEIEPGCDAVRTRLKKRGDGRPRFMLKRDAVWRRDPELELKHIPASTYEEIWGYVYDPKTGKPVDKNNHGCDALRYKLATKDLQPEETFTQTKLRR